MADKVLLNQSAKKVERELYRSSSLLTNLKELNGSLESIYSNLLKLEGLAEENPVIAKKLREQFRETKILPLFKKMEQNLVGFRGELERLEDSSLKANLFLEGMRGERTYKFRDEVGAREFIEELLSALAVEEVTFRPEFIGVTDLSGIAEELEVEKGKNQALKVPSHKVQRLFEIVSKSTEPKNFRIETGLFRLWWNTKNQFSVEAETGLLKRIDRISKNLEATFFEG